MLQPRQNPRNQTLCQTQSEIKKCHWLVRILFVLFRFLTSSPATRLFLGRVLRPASDNLKCCDREVETGKQGDHDLCLSRSRYTDTDPTSRDLAPGVGIEPTNS